VGGARHTAGSDSESSINEDVTVEDTKRINTAVFYSITSTQRGLQGVELGGQVIKRVVLDLVTEFPRMMQFASLSPVPGFRDWMLEEISTYVRLREMGEDPQQLLLTAYELAEMSAVFNVPEMVLFSVLREVLSGDDWIEQPHVVNVLQAPLLRLCARYLYVEKKRGYALNPVANFHLRNGAVLWRLNWLADTSPRGVTVSCTIMANYRYYLDDIDSNSRNYAENQVLAASDQVLDLVRQLPASTQVATVNSRLSRESVTGGAGR
jgi:malonyl-CoA decarboxylase